MHSEPCIAFVGESKVGKTALICRVFGDFFPSIHHATTENIYNLNLFVLNKTETVQLIDTSGKRCPDDEALQRLAQAFVVVFSVKNKKSFDTAARLVERLSKDRCGPVLLVGNQAEEYDTASRRQVDEAEANRLATTQGVVEYVEMSAMDEVNTDGLRQRLACLLACIGGGQDLHPTQHSRSETVSVADDQLRGRKSSSPLPLVSRRVSLRSKARAKKHSSAPLCSTPLETPGSMTPCAGCNRPVDRPSASVSAPTSASVTAEIPPRRAEGEGQTLNQWLIEDYLSEKHRRTDADEAFANAHEVRQQDKSLVPRLRQFANLWAKASQGFQGAGVRFAKFKRSLGGSQDDASINAKQDKIEHAGRQQQFESMAERVSRARSFRVQRRPVRMFEPTAQQQALTASDRAF